MDEGQGRRARTRLGSAVRHFSAQMLERLLLKHEQGYYGWDDAQYADVILEKLRANVERAASGDWRRWVDVANFSLMLWYHAWIAEEPSRRA